MRKFTTADRLNQIIRERNIKQVDVLRACLPYCEKYNIQLKKNDLSQYVSGRIEPKQDKLSVLAMGLNVNEVWLMGYDVPPGRNALERLQRRIASNNISLQYDTDAEEMLNMYIQLDSTDQAEIRGEMKQMLKAEKYSVGKKATALHPKETIPAAKEPQEPEHDSFMRRGDTLTDHGRIKLKDAKIAAYGGYENPVATGEDLEKLKQIRRLLQEVIDEQHNQPGE